MGHCNDLKCIDRFPLSLEQCTNRNCSESAHVEMYPLEEMISTIIITPHCSSDMVKKIDSFHLKPIHFKIDKKWNKK